MADRIGDHDLPDRADVVIVGGGIVGVCVAYFLAAKGMKEICLLERDSLGSGSTGRCAGGIRVHFSTEVNVRLSMMTLELLKELQMQTGTDPEFKRVGYLFLATCDQYAEVFKENQSLLMRLGQELLLMDPCLIQQRWPFLRTDDLKTGAFSPQDGYAGPYEVLMGYAKAARRLGVSICEGVEATGISLSRRGWIKGMRTSVGKDISTSLVINAAGPWASQVARMAQVEIPVRPHRRQIFFSGEFNGRVPLDCPVIIEVPRGWYMRRECRGLLLAGPQEEHPSFNESTDFNGRLWCAQHSINRVPILREASIVRGWAGLYAVSPDRHAIIGSLPERPGMVFVNGFSGHGFQHAPAVGKLVSDWIVDGQTTEIDITPLSPIRFREGRWIHEPLTALRASL